jgi:hypothetical protein
VATFETVDVSVTTNRWRVDGQSQQYLGENDVQTTPQQEKTCRGVVCPWSVKWCSKKEKRAGDARNSRWTQMTDAAH